MIVWANRLSLPLLDVSHRPVPGRARSALRGHRAFATPRSTSRPSIASRACSASCVRPPGTSAPSGWAQARPPTVDRAWWKALAEAFAAARRARSSGSSPAAGRAARSSPFEDHIRHHADAGRAGQSAFLTSSRARTPVDRVPAPEWRSHADAVAALCDRVEAAGSTRLRRRRHRARRPRAGPRPSGRCSRPSSARSTSRMPPASSAAGVSTTPRCRSASATSRSHEADVNPDPHPFP